MLILRGENPVEEWTLLLWANMAMEVQSAQSAWQWLMQSLRYCCSNSWFILSVCPSVCGWQAVEGMFSMPRNLWKLTANLD